MKYKVKQGCHTSDKVSNSIYLSEGTTIEPQGKGRFIFIPFTDTRFFEPVKTRKFQVEVSEEHMDHFNFYVNDGDPHWTVTEITEPTVPFWVIEFTSGHVNTSIKSFEGIDPVWIVNNFKGQKLYAIKWVKDHTSAWLKDCKDLVDYIFDTFN